MTRGKLWRWAGPLLVVASLLFQVPAVFAHAIVISTDPVDGAVLSESPSQVRVVFSEQILLPFTNVELIDGNGNTVAVKSVKLESSANPTLVVDLPGLAPSAYRLIWRTLSADDLHTSNGSLVFGVQQAAALAPAPLESIPTPWEVAVRWLNFGALAALTGSLTTGLLLLPASQAPYAFARKAARGRLLNMAFWAIGLACTAGGGLLLIQSIQAGAATNLPSLWLGVTQILSLTDYGARWLRWQLLLIGVGVVIVLLRRRDKPANSMELLTVAPLILALTVLQALSSHAAGLENASLLQIGMDVLHLLAACLWAGGLLALAIGVAPMLRRGGEETALAWATFRRFGGLAATCVAVLIATGIYNSGQQVASVDALLFTLYGQSLLLKFGFVILVGIFGLFNAAILHPAVGRQVAQVFRQNPHWRPFASHQLGWTVLAESVGAGLILLLAALLSAAQPARGPEFEPAALAESSLPLSYTEGVADLVITLSVKPNHPGQNFIILDVLNTRRPAPAPIAQVNVNLASPDGLNIPAGSAQDLGNGKYQIVGDALKVPGTWQIGVQVVRPGLPVVSTTVQWLVQPIARNVPRRPVVVSNQPLAPILSVLAAGCVVIAALCLFGMKFARSFVNLPSNSVEDQPQPASRD